MNKSSLNINYLALIKVNIKVLIFLFIYSCGSVENYKQKILYLPGIANGKEAAIAKQNNLSEIYFFNQSEFAPLDSLDRELLKQSIEKRIPNENEIGYAVLDWEGGKEIALNQQKNITTFNIALDQFIETIKFAKKMRPNIKWSFYGFPTTEFWNANLDWKKRNKNLKSLFEVQDYLAPSIYLFYGDNQIKSILTNSYLNNNLSLALELGNEYNKEVFPFIWHRFHPSDKNVGMSLIPLDFFDYYTKKILKYNNFNRRVSGVIWWQSEYYYYQTRDEHLNLRLEYEHTANPTDYHLSIFKNYLKILENNILRK